MIGKLWRKQPWRDPFGRLVRRTRRARRKSAPDRVDLFENLGLRQIASPVGRCLIAYNPRFIRHLYQRPEVGPNGWDPDHLQSHMVALSNDFPEHTMYWESAELVRQCIALGFVVDYVCDRHGSLVQDVSKYDVVIDEWTNLGAWSSLNTVARKLFYSTGAHWVFHNKAELTRHAWLFERRGVAVPTSRQVPPISGSQCADLIGSFGNATNWATFGPDAFRIRKLWISAVDDDVRLEAKDWTRARNSFLYFAGGGWVHKGLDLVVEAFLREPTLKLTVVGGGGFGDIDRDPDFLRIYGREIEKAGNIVVRGFLNIHSRGFLDIVASCCGVVSPSAAEGCSGAVVQCLHHGLIPVVTPIVGLELHYQWPALGRESDVELIDEIGHRCQQLAGTPEADLEELRRFIWEYARTHHTRASYAASLSRVLHELIK